MGKLTRIELVGNNLVLFGDDGKRIACYPSFNGFRPRVPVEISAAGENDPGGDADIDVGEVPDSLSAKDTNGQVYNLNKTQLTHAAEIITAASKIDNVGTNVLIISLITALVESVLYMYSNSANVPSSVNYPHDRDGSDHDSIGLFQQRPSIGWGSVAELMDPAYNTRAFIGGPSGPNKGNPPGLFDVDGWSGMTPGRAAQAVQGSQFPDRYDVVVPVAKAIIAALVTSKPGAGGGDSGDWRWPFKYSQYVLSDPRAQFGMRVNPATGVYTMHRGLDFGGGGIAGKPVTAAAAGVVSIPPVDGRGYNVSIKHDHGWETHYFHMIAGSISVSAGQQVQPGTKLGLVGSTGQSTGSHLHWETLENGEVVNPRDFMKARGVPES